MSKMMYDLRISETVEVSAINFNVYKEER